MKKKYVSIIFEAILQHIIHSKIAIVDQGRALIWVQDTQTNVASTNTKSLNVHIPSLTALNAL